MPKMKRAALDGNREATQENQRTRIFASHQSVGNCSSCGTRIRLLRGVSTCSTCSAWSRWYSAHRLASRYLREAAR